MADDTERALTLRLPQSLHEQIRERARQEDRSVAQVLRVAARSYLAAPPPVPSVEPAQA